MRLRGFALSASLAALVACGGLLGFGDDDEGAPAPPTDAGAIIDASVDNFAITAEAASPDPVCAVFDGGPDSGARGAVAARSRTAKTVDGDFDDYGSAVALMLDGTSALIEGTPVATAAVKIEWEPTALWLAFDVSDQMLVGNDTDASYNNDSIELYISSVSCRDGCYGKRDHHYVVDHTGFALDYSNANYSRSLFDAQAAVIATPGTGYRVEMRIDPVVAFGKELVAGEQIFLDTKLNDGLNQAGFRIWSMHPTEDAGCPCRTCYPYPAFDNRLFSPVTLAP